MKKEFLRKSIFLFLLCFMLQNVAFSQIYEQFNNYFDDAHKSGTLLMYAHQDDDIIWMLPFWSRTGTFVQGALPTTPDFSDIIHDQQVYMDGNGFDTIDYEQNWLNPWDPITDPEYTGYYFSNLPEYSYLLLDHIEAGVVNVDLTRPEIDKVKAKIEQYIADPSVTRIITQNNWGESGHRHHKALNIAVRELAVKYRKEVWMLGITGDFNPVELPANNDVHYTTNTYNLTLYDAIRTIYQNHYYWTYYNDFEPGTYNYIRMVYQGNDYSQLFNTGMEITEPGDYQSLSGSYMFDGVDDWMTKKGNSSANFTIAMRINPDLIQEMDISKMTEYPTSTTFDRNFYMQNDGRITASINDGSAKSVSSTTALSAGTWAHVVMSYNGTDLKIYVNGVEEGSIASGNPITSYITPEFVLGRASATANYFNGQIADLYYYDYALSAGEIATLVSTRNPAQYTLTGSAGTGGSISPSGTTNVIEGGSRTFTISPSIGYQIADVLVDNVSVGAVTTYTFSSVAANHTISVTFSAMPNIALNKPASGQSYVTGNGPSLANDANGTNDSFWSATPYPQWWKVDLQGVYNISGIVIRNYYDGTRYYHYTIEASTDDVTYTQIAAKSDNDLATDAGDPYSLSTTARYLRVNVTYDSDNEGVHISDFKVYGTINTNYHLITSSVGTGGSINPAVGTVLHGANQTFNIIPNVGYQITDVLVDGGSVGAVSSYTFTNVTAAHTISATFSALTSIALNKPTTCQSYSYEGVGSSMANDADGSNDSYWAADSYPQWWVVDLEDVYDLSGVVVRNYVDGDRYYQYTIESSIDGQTYTQVAAKANTNVATDAGDSYPLSSTSARYLRVNITFNSVNPSIHMCDFRAYGAISTSYHSITASAGTGGTITPTGESFLINGASQAYTITSNMGYRIADVLVDGLSVGAVSSYSFTNVVANHTIAVSFTSLPSLALNKPATAQSYYYEGVEPSKANDSDGSNASYWSANLYPQWWKVDLGASYDVTGIIIRNYVDNVRYYRYNIEVSNDDVTYTQIINKSNSNIATDAGDSYPVSTTARYLRVNMTFNSVNPDVHICDFKVFGNYRITASAGTGGTITPAGTSSVSYGGSQTYTITAR